MKQTVLILFMLPCTAIFMMSCVGRMALTEEKNDAETVSIREDFEHPKLQWETTDAQAWKIIREGKNASFSLERQCDYEPPVRSPFSIAWIKDMELSDFTLTLKVRSVCLSYPPHRDICLFFGGQDPSHFYYVHFSRDMDPRANQIFIVNGAPRKRITVKKDRDGSPWKDGVWHTLKLERDTASGAIRAYFDDMETPVMEAQDKTFLAGRIGIGSFDDAGQFDDIELHGIKIQ
ncbi:hypothetical protein JXA32_14255 [Candidatus Sumerlaeota bacterium]|nr:hypothetical protein [Candidatus Sumerlaeota bacterium]